MRLLLDTHIFLWGDNYPDQLSAQAKALCQDPSDTLAVSVASVWEMQIKQQLGKLRLRLPMAEVISSQQANGLELLPITTEHIYALQDLPPHHKDPFDRLLIAQANVEQIALVTADETFQQYDVKLLG